MAESQNVQAAISRSAGGDLVEFGAVFNGVFFPFAAVRAGDFDEAVAAGVQAQQAQPAQPVQEPEQPVQQ